MFFIASSAAALFLTKGEGTLMLFHESRVKGRHSFAYFSVAVDRKVSRLEGEIECEKGFKQMRIY